MSSEQEFISKWYARLCAMARQSERLAPSTLCIHCGKEKKDHIELRCTISALTSHYRATDRSAVELNINTLADLERLAATRGWDLLETT